MRSTISHCATFSRRPHTVKWTRELCAALGSRFDGLDDDDVEKYFRQKRAREIAEFCERDVVSIFCVGSAESCLKADFSPGFQRSEETLEG